MQTMDESKFVSEVNLVSSSMSFDKFTDSAYAKTISSVSVFSSSHPLFSCMVTFCTLVFLYFPRYLFWKIVFSPVVILTGILLITILRLGAIQKSQHQHIPEPVVILNEENRASKKEKQSPTPTEHKDTKCPEQVNQWIKSQMGFEPSSSSSSSSPCFVEWNVKAPLEVIYEEYEEEEEEEEAREDDLNMWHGGVQRCPSLGHYYPETDSDTSSESEFPAMQNICFRWGDEEDREGLIEIPLPLDERNNKTHFHFHLDEDNLIEIDISPPRYKIYCD